MCCSDILAAGMRMLVEPLLFARCYTHPDLVSQLTAKLLGTGTLLLANSVDFNQIAPCWFVRWLVVLGLTVL